MEIRVSFGKKALYLDFCPRITRNVEIAASGRLAQPVLDPLP